MARYRPRPVFQLRPDAAHANGSELRSKNCNPSAAATLVDYVSCGKRRTTGAAVRELTGDTREGITLRQVASALERGFGVELDVNTASFASVIVALRAGRGVSLCGSSNATRGTRWQASETFAGNHQWALTDIRFEAGRPTDILVFDPLADGRRSTIAKSPMWIPVSVVRKFASGLDLRSREEIAAKRPRRPLGQGRATYAVTDAVACMHAGPAPGAVKLRRLASRVNGGAGTSMVVVVSVARVRAAPSTRAPILGRKRLGQVFRVHQRIKSQQVAGNPIWFGDGSGARWIHSSLLRED